MKKIDLSTMPTPNLVREFNDIAIQQSYAEARAVFVIARSAATRQSISLQPPKMDCRVAFGSSR